MKIMFLSQEPRQPEGSEFPSIAEKAKRLSTYASAGTTIEMGWPEDTPGAGIKTALGKRKALNGLHHILEAKPIIQKIVWAHENGFDAVVMSNTFDPGVEGARMAVPIPVIGICRTCLGLASTLADRIGIVVPLAGHAKEVERLVQAYGMKDRVVAIRPIGRYGKEFVDEKSGITSTVTDMINRMVDDCGAEIILPLGGALIPWIIDPADLQTATGAPVMHTHRIAIAFAEMSVRIGLSHSALAYQTAQGLTHKDFLSLAHT